MVDKLPRKADLQKLFRRVRSCFRLDNGPKGVKWAQIRWHPRRLYPFSVVITILGPFPTATPWPLSAALEQVVSAHPVPGDQDAPPQFIAKRTLEDWYYAFKTGGFDGLKPKRRSDQGKPRRLSAQQQQWILEQVRCFPGVPVKLLYRQWKQADFTLPALSAVYRWLEQNDLDRSSQTKRGGSELKTLLADSVDSADARCKPLEAPGLRLRHHPSKRPEPVARRQCGHC